MGDSYKARLDSEKQILELVQQDASSFDKETLLDLLSVVETRVDATDENGMTALMHAAYKGNTEACRVLLKKGANVNCNYHEHFYSALMFGTMSGSLETVNLLLEHGAYVGASNKSGRTAAQLGAFVGQHACVTAISNFLSVEELEYYAAPHDLEVVSKLPSCVVHSLHRCLITTNLHPVHLMNYYAENLELCQYHTRVTNALEDFCAKKAKQSCDAISLKIHYVLFLLKGFITIGPESYLSKCLTQRTSDGSYVDRDSYLRECMRVYPHVHNSVWKQLVASASKISVGGTPSMLSMLHSAIIGRAEDSEGDEECSNCGSTAPDLRKCSRCKKVSYCNSACQKQSWEFGSHKKMCKLYRQAAPSS